MLTSQNLAGHHQLGVSANMEYTIYSHGNITVLSVERGFRQEKCSNRCIGICCSLAINVIWSLVFFGTHNIFGGLVLVLTPWISILINIVVFYRISKPAGLILIPYLMWVSIASYLNYAVFLLNH